MKTIPSFKDIMLRNNLQLERYVDSANRGAFYVLSGLGFSLPAIRKALLDLNQIKLHEISEEVTRSTLSMTIKGHRRDKRAQRIIVQKLGLEIEELFPEP